MLVRRERPCRLYKFPLATLIAVAAGSVVGIGLQQAGFAAASKVSASRQTRTRRDASSAPYPLFESGQVRPLALSPGGTRLFVLNTPANCLEVFGLPAVAGFANGAATSSANGNPVGTPSLSLLFSVPVGLEPVAIAARSEGEVWVVNHLSDSVSIVDVNDAATARVIRTLWVGDEPRDIVFAGPAHDRAFVTTAHRGQNSPVDPQLTTPGVGRADVWVFDANQLGDSPGGAPITILTLFADTPRALAATPDGQTVYAAAFHSGNRTTTIPVGSIPTDGLPLPHTNFLGVPGPAVGLIVKYRQSSIDGQMHWLDELERNWDEIVRFSLPDQDVFVIDATADPPTAGGPGNAFIDVGTILFNMVVNPVTGSIYVSNTDARNDERFEGPGIFAGHSVRGHLVESRISILKDGVVTPRHLNKHIDYTHCCDSSPNAESLKSLAFPMDMAISANGRTLYVAAFGSSKIGIFDTAELEEDQFTPDENNQIVVTGGGPSGLALDEPRGVLYVLTRFDNGVSVVDPVGRQELLHLQMPNPEPPSIVNGRRFLYDATLTSSHGDSACASCHVFGDFDSLAWDLGNPDGTVLDNPGPFTVLPSGQLRPFHPMKGPMTTQSLRGLDNHGPMHWRGDRTGGNDVAGSQQPDTGSFDEVEGFKKFNVAFPGLLGRSDQLTDQAMQAFTDFVLQITYPPNPIRNLDGSLTAEQQAGRDFFFGVPSGLPSDTFETCQGCHVLDPDGNREYGVARPGFFGTDGRSSFENETQLFKIPHLRNLYQKVGMFGMAPDPFFPNDPTPFMGDQVRGFGFLHDGSVDTLFRFHGAGVFVRRDPQNPGGIPNNDEGRAIRRQLQAFLLAFDTNLAPIVGQQATLTATNARRIGPRLDLLEARARAGDCDLVVRGRVGSVATRFLYQAADGTFVERAPGHQSLTDGDLRALAARPRQELTFTCVPPGSGDLQVDDAR